MTNLVRSGSGRLAAVAAAALLLGLTTGWAASGFRGAKPAQPRSTAGVVSAADRIKTDFWRTFRETGAVVMVGDSHTDFADWAAMFPEAGIINRGVGGDTTRAVLARLDTILSVSAGTAVVTLGTNDILQGEPLGAIATNYHAILDRLEDSGARVIVTSTPLTASPRTNMQVEALNADLAAYCTRTACAFVDLNAVIGIDGLLNPRMSVDGVHLNGAGYAQWAAALAPYLRTQRALANEAGTAPTR